MTPALKSAISIIDQIASESPSLKAMFLSAGIANPGKERMKTGYFLAYFLTNVITASIEQANDVEALNSSLALIDLASRSQLEQQGFLLKFIPSHTLATWEKICAESATLKTLNEHRRFDAVSGALSNTLVLRQLTTTILKEINSWPWPSSTPLAQQWIQLMQNAENQRAASLKTVPTPTPSPATTSSPNLAELQIKFDKLGALLDTQKRFSELATSASIDFRHPSHQALDINRFLPTLPFPIAIYGLEREAAPVDKLEQLDAYAKELVDHLTQQPFISTYAYQAFINTPFAVNALPASFQLPATLFGLITQNPYAIAQFALAGQAQMYQLCKSMPEAYLHIVTQDPKIIEAHETYEAAPFKILKDDPLLALSWLTSKAKDPNKPLDSPFVLEHFQLLLAHIASTQHSNPFSLYCQCQLAEDPLTELHKQFTGHQLINCPPQIALQVSYELHTKAPTLLMPEFFCLANDPKWLYNKLKILEQPATATEELLLTQNAPWGIQYLEDCSKSVNAPHLLKLIEDQNTNPHWVPLIAAYKARKAPLFDPFNL